jgi:uncharacterized protein YgiM (DUF1202 family)
MIRRWLYVLVVLMLGGIVTAQDPTCTEIQLAAFDATAAYCPHATDYGVCYGNPTATVDYNQMGDDQLTFTEPGDRVPSYTVASFNTSTDGDTWGTVHNTLYVISDDVDSGVLATMVAFGNVSVTNSGTLDISVISNSGAVNNRKGANLRAQPTTDARVVTAVMYNNSLLITGKLADESWLRVHISKDDFAWVASEFVNVNDMSQIPVVAPDDIPDRLSSPFQSFEFQSGLPRVECTNGGLSGILLQVYPPTSQEMQTFEVNGVSIMLNGAVFLQSHPNTGLLVSVIDGRADIVALGESLAMDEGYVSRILLELDDNSQLVVAEPPTAPRQYNYDALLALPLELLAEGTTLGQDISALITPRPMGGESPIADMGVDEPCRLTTGETGANIRSAPNPRADILGVLAYRESVEPIARTIGTDGLPWWQLADNVWMRVDASVTGGDCIAIPRIEYDG